MFSPLIVLSLFALPQNDSVVYELTLAASVWLVLVGLAVGAALVALLLPALSMLRQPIARGLRNE